MASAFDLLFKTLLNSLLISSVICNAMLHDHFLLPPYKESDVVLTAVWKFVNSQIQADHILLTPEEPYKNGGIWSNIPLLKRDWEFQVVFRIEGSKLVGGNGMALWYVTDPGEEGPVFGNKNFFRGVGVFIDISSDFGLPHNHLHPYISAMVNNGTVSYYHDMDGTYRELGQCTAPFRNLPHESRIAVSYKNDVLSVYVGSDKSAPWTLCFMSQDVHLPTGGFFGVTASNGENSDNVKIISVTGIDMTTPGEPFIDRSFIIPRAENYRKEEAIRMEKMPPNVLEDPIELQNEIPISPPKPKIEEPIFESKPPDPEIKKPQEEKEKVREEILEKPQFETNREKRETPHREDLEPQKPQDDVKETKLKDQTTKSWSWLSKCLIVGIFAIGVILVRLLLKHLTYRREVMSKRMY